MVFPSEQYGSSSPITFTAYSVLDAEHIATEQSALRAPAPKARGPAPQAAGGHMQYNRALYILRAWGGQNVFAAALALVL
jgi:hypothetical protein